MPAATRRSTERDKVSVRPSKVDLASARPFTLDQELKPFGTWVNDPIWVPPKDSSKEMAESMLRQPGLFTWMSQRWDAVVETHRDSFTQVREIELNKASIRLPKGRLFVSVTEQKDFDSITDVVPDCIQTRLEEFLAGPGRRSGAKVFYLKPLCVEVDDDLHFTSRNDVMAAINTIQKEVFAKYRRLYFPRRCEQIIRSLANGCLAIPRAIANRAVQQRKRAIDEYQAKLEFQRRKLALRAANAHSKLRTDGCTFDEMLDLTNPLQREDVIGQYAIENQLARAKQQQLLRIAAGNLPWFVALTMGLTYVASVVAIMAAPPVAVCDPAFVAEFPNSGGGVVNIGHFDEVAGVKHIEL